MTDFNAMTEALVSCDAAKLTDLVNGPSGLIDTMSGDHLTAAMFTSSMIDFAPPVFHNGVPFPISSLPLAAQNPGGGTNFSAVLEGAAYAMN